MARNYTSTSTVNLQVNAKQASQMLDKLKKDTANLEKQFKKAEAAGDKVAMKKLRQSIKENEKLMRMLTTETAQAADVLKRLDRATPKELNKTLKTLRSELSSMQRGTDAWNKQVAAIKRVKAEIDKVNASMAMSKTGWQKFNGWLNNTQTAIMGIVAAVTGLIAAGRQAVNRYAEMDESVANSVKYTRMSRQEVEQLNDSFKKMDTRLFRDQLNLLAQEGGRLGYNTIETVKGYTEAAQIINVALVDLGEGATQTIAKLTNIFGVEKALGIKKAMLSVGSAVNVLSQNCTASKPYLVNFAQRMAGIGAQAGMTIPQILALGAVLDANGQKVEMSATAIQKVMMNLANKNKEFAQTLGLDAEELNKTLKTSAIDGLMMFLQRLHDIGESSSYENTTMVLAPAFKEMGLDAARVAQVLSTLSKHIDEIKWQLGEADTAFREASSATDEFNIFNNTAQATIDKAKGRVRELATELGEKLFPIMKHIYTSSGVFLRVLNTMVTFFIKYRTELIILTSAITAYHLIINLAAIKTFALAKAQAAWNAVTAVTKGIVPVLKLLFAGLANGVQYFTNGLQVNYAMQQRWQKAVKGMSLANWTGVILSVVAALALLAKKLNDNAEKVKKLREEQAKYIKEASELSEKTINNAEKEISALKTLYKAAIDEKNAKEERIDAAKKLLALYPDQFKNLSAEEIMLGKAKTAYDNLTKSILANAKAKAAAEKVLENQKEILELQDQLDNSREKYKKADKKIEEEKKKTEEDKERIYNSAGTGFIIKETAAPALASARRDRKAAGQEIDETKAKIRVKEEANQKLINTYSGNKSFSSTINSAAEEAADPGDSSFTDYTPEESEKEKKEREAADRKAAAEARRQAIKEKQEFKDALKQIKAQRDKDEIEAKSLRMEGEIDYRQYFELMREAEWDWFLATKQLYEKHHLEDDADYIALLEKDLDAEKKYNDQRLALDKETTERIAKMKEQEAKANYASLRNPSMADELRLKEEILSINFNKLMDLQQMYDRGSKEWENYEMQIQDLLSADMMDKKKTLVAKAAEYQKEFDKLSVTEKYKLEREALKTLYDMKYIKEDEYRRWLGALDKKEKKERKEEKDALPGSSKNKSPEESAKSAQKKYNEEKKKLDDALAKGVIDEKEYASKLAVIKSELYEALISPLKESKSEWVSLISSMTDAWMDFANALKDPDGNPLDGLTKGLEATVAVMSAVMSQITEFTKAEMQIQTAAIEKRYDREISFAEGNSYLTKKLEKKKQEEIAQIKEDAANKEFSMQVIMAIAQTATNALNAYGSAAAIPVVGHVLAPIAAATAVAAGLVQVAAIKKQKEAAAATGYSKGGFTRPGDVDEPAGVVHAGEWVASQKLVKSPVARPIIDMLEYAQRTNRIGSLSMEDVSRSISAPMMLAYSKPEPEVIQVAAPSPDPGSQVGTGLSKGDLASSIDRLNRRLDAPIVAVSTVAGEFGSKQAQERYDRMIRNKSRRKRS